MHRSLSRMALRLLPILLAPTISLHAHDLHQATYLGNEGVMVRNGETKVLFDAFYADSYGQYLLIPDPILAAMIAGEPPYDDVDALFVSHVHGDHFSAAPAIEYLRAQPGVDLYGPVQVIEAIRTAGVDEEDPIHQRLHVLDLSPEQDAVSFMTDELQIDVVAVPHAGNLANIQNYVWRVTLDEHTTVMHLGDADPNPKHFVRHLDHFQHRVTDRAFPPYWFFLNDPGKQIMAELLNARQTTGIHVPAEAQGQGDEWRTRLGGDVFTDPGETRELTGE